MSVRLVNAGAWAFAGANTPTAVPAPADIIAGNLLVVTGHFAPGDTTKLTLSTANEFQLHPDEVVANSEVLKLCWKIAEGGDDMPSLTGATGVGSGHTLSLRCYQFEADGGFDPDDPWGLSADASSGAAAVNLGPVSSPGAVALGALAFCVAHRADDAGSNDAFTVSGGWTKQADHFTQAGSDMHVLAATRAGNDDDPGGVTFSAIGAPAAAVWVGRQYVIEEAAEAPSPPVAGFTPSATSGRAPLSVTFTDTSVGSPTSWSWDFGDGSVDSTEQSPTHEFATPGTYTVTLTATNANGSDEATAQIVATGKVKPGNSTPQDGATWTIPLPDGMVEGAVALVFAASNVLPSGATSGTQLVAWRDMGGTRAKLLCYKRTATAQNIIDNNLGSISFPATAKGATTVGEVVDADPDQIIGSWAATGQAAAATSFEQSIDPAQVEEVVMAWAVNDAPEFSFVAPANTNVIADTTDPVEGLALLVVQELEATSAVVTRAATSASTSQVAMLAVTLRSPETPPEDPPPDPPPVTSTARPVRLGGKGGIHNPSTMSIGGGGIRNP